jgi:hypothetical protein
MHPTQHRVERADDETVRNRSVRGGAGVALSLLLLESAGDADPLLGLLGLALFLGVGWSHGPWMLEGMKRASIWYQTRDYPTDPSDELHEPADDRHGLDDDRPEPDGPEVSAGD